MQYRINTTGTIVHLWNAHGRDSALPDAAAGGGDPLVCSLSQTQ